MGLQESLQVGVKVEDEQLMETDQPGDHVESQQFYFKSFIGSLQSFKQLLGKSLGVVDKMKCGKVKGGSFRFFLLLFLDQSFNFLQLFFSLPALFVESI